MRIGIDFDNTIACYDGVFHAAARERDLIPDALGIDKTTVRNYLRKIGQEDDWTELQGYVYGARMDLVAVYEGFHSFVKYAREQGHDLIIISHKTKTPFMGPSYDLHAAARAFLEKSGIVSQERVPRVCFELTLEEKAARISSEGCDCFIDDLPELLEHEKFPETVRSILFDPDGHYLQTAHDGRRLEKFASWGEITSALLD